jgi:hypothetical protein
MKKLITILFALMVTLGAFAQNHWVPNIHQFPTNMNVIATIEVNGIEQQNNYLELGVFCGDEVRGSQMLDYYDAPVDRYLAFLTVYGQNGDVLTFRLYDHFTEQELEMTCSNQMTYLSNDIIGMLFTPYVFDFSGGGDCAVNVTIDPADSGEVSGAGNVPCGSYCTLTATPLDGGVFLGWTYGDETLTTDTEFSFNVLGNVSFVAHFQAPTPVYTVTVSAQPEVGGAVDGGDEYEEGALCEVTATAYEGYEFHYWMEGEEVISEEPAFSFEVYADRDLVAVFEHVVEPVYHEIMAEVDPEAGGTVSGADIYEEGEYCTLLVNLNPLYAFVNWTEDGVEVSTENPYRFEVTRPRVLVANVVYSNEVLETLLNSFLYPNPTQGKVILALPETMVEPCIVVYDVNGKRMMTTKTPSLDLSGLSDGVYYVTVNGCQVGKIVLKR